LKCNGIQRIEEQQQQIQLQNTRMEKLEAAIAKLAASEPVGQ